MTTLILPCLDGSGPGHWQRHWLQHFDDCLLVEQSDWHQPRLDGWLATAAGAVEAHPGAILVGHSLGAILIAHLAARRPDLPIAGTLLVAPADVDAVAGRRRPGLGEFAPIPTGPFGFASIVVGSRNDPWMRFDRARILANLWEASFVDLGACGHIKAESGLGAWSQGRALLSRLQRLRPPSRGFRPPAGAAASLGGPIG